MDSKGTLDVTSLKKRNILKRAAFDIHKAIEKLPRPRHGLVPQGYRYLGPLKD